MVRSEGLKSLRATWVVPMELRLRYARAVGWTYVVQGDFNPSNNPFIYPSIYTIYTMLLSILLVLIKKIY